MKRATSVLLEGLAFPEGPRWHDGRLWFSDMHADRVKRVGLDGKSEDVVEVPGRPSGLGWLPDGRLLVVSMADRRLLRLDANGLAQVADLSALATGHCNDMVVDERGRAYVGNFGFDLDAGEAPRTADLVLVTPEGDARSVASDLSFPNGTVIAPDGATLIVGETYAQRLTAFDVASDGTLSGRRTWAQLNDRLPDGICLDAEGGIWVAAPFSGEVLRVVEGGEVSDRIAVTTQAYACMLGGPDGCTLFVCTADSHEPEKCRAEATGRIEIAEVEVPGAGLP